MKNLIIITLLLGYSAFTHGQINMLRYNDNFTKVKNDSIQKKGFTKMKHVLLFGGSNISFGGEVREQFQYYENQNFGDIPLTFSKVSTGQLWHRAMAHTNIEVGDKLRIFAQLGSTVRFLNPNPLTPEIDENQLSLHQAFIEYNFLKQVAARIGRQEISYGNNRLLTFREGPNTRLSFDAVILKYHAGKRKMDVFALTPVTSKPGIFDDKSFEDLLIGIYATENIEADTYWMDYYFINFNSDRRVYNHIAGRENRQIYGIRFFTQKEKFNYELEATYQSGKFNELNIGAYGISADVNYNFISKNNFQLGLSANYFTGDKAKSDNQLNTYNLLFSKPQYGLAAPIGSSNIVSLNQYIRISSTKKMSTYGSVTLMWRQNNQDGTYSPAGLEVRPNPSFIFLSTEREIGTLVSLETSYSANRHLSFAFDMSYFLPGKYVKETGRGKDITYISVRGGFKF